MASSPIRRILVPVDFSQGAAEALSFARALAAPLGASIEVLHVADASGRMPEESGEPRSTDPAELLHQFVATGEPAGSVPTTARVERGDVRDRIVAVAEEGGFDMIVMGTQGRTGRTRALVGSVAESVVRTSPRPVLTVREGGARTPGRAG